MIQELSLSHSTRASIQFLNTEPSLDEVRSDRFCLELGPAGFRGLRALGLQGFRALGLRA